jgi:hypothetical protein
VAAVGKNRFSVSSDRRLAVQPRTNFHRAFKIHNKLYIGLSGRHRRSDAVGVQYHLICRLGHASLVSALLYEKR